MLYNESDETNICNIHKKEGASRKYYIHHSSFIYNQFKKLNLCKFYSNRVINHLMSILISIFISGYHGKTTDFAKNSSCHRTTIAHFLNSGKWNDSLLSDTLKQSVIEIIYSETARTGNPVFCIMDDTIASKTKPLSRALHPIEDAYFHQSHLKKKQDYGHQAVAVMLSCNGIVLNYAFVMYNKSISKIDIVQNIAKELAAELSVTHNGFDLATVKKRKYYVYRYEGNLNGIENAVVLLSYPEKAFGNSKALRAFISTQELVSSALSRPDITRSAALFSRKSIDIFSNVQRKAMILTHL